MSTISLGPVALQILEYLSAHQEAQDTVEGIAEWWSLERRTRLKPTVVREALAELVARGMVREFRGLDRRIRYAARRRRPRTPDAGAGQKKGRIRKP